MPKYNTFQEAVEAAEKYQRWLESKPKEIGPVQAIVQWFKKLVREKI